MASNSLTPTKVVPTVAALAIGLALSACASATEPVAVAPPAPDIRLPISYNEVMVASVDHAAHELWNAVIEEGMPTDDQGWTELEHHAWQIVTASAAIQLPGTGVGDATWSESPDWTRLAEEMSGTAMDAAEAARNHDMMALSTVGDRLVEVCTECHEVFKPEVPSEGIFHPHYR